MKPFCTSDSSAFLSYSDIDLLLSVIVFWSYCKNIPLYRLAQNLFDNGEMPFSFFLKEKRSLDLMKSRVNAPFKGRAKKEILRANWIDIEFWVKLLVKSRKTNGSFSYFSECILRNQLLQLRIIHTKLVESPPNQYQLRTWNAIIGYLFSRHTISLSNGTYFVHILQQASLFLHVSLIDWCVAVTFIWLIVVGSKAPCHTSHNDSWVLFISCYIVTRFESLS